MRTKGLVLGGGSYLEAGKQKFVLTLIDLDTSEPDPYLVSTSFLPHGLAFHPRERLRAAVFEKKGPGACIVDLGKGVVARPITTTSSRRFYGHGAYSSDGSLLYATESVIDRAYEGVLVVRDARTLAELGVVPTHGRSPHDCVMIDDGKTMVVANGGGSIDGGEPGSVTVVELSSGKLLDRVEMAPGINAGHVAVTAQGDLAVVSAPRDGLPSPDKQLGGVTLRPHGGAARRLDEPEAIARRMLGESLSVVVDERRRRVLATHPLGDCVSVWALDDGASLGTIELRDPRGGAMTLDGAWFVVSHVEGRSVRLSAFSTDDLALVRRHVDPSFISGSHIFVHAA